MSYPINNIVLDLPFCHLDDASFNLAMYELTYGQLTMIMTVWTQINLCLINFLIASTINREFKLRVSGNGKRQVRTFFAKFSLNVFVSYFLSCVERIIMHCSFKTASSFTLCCLIP
jgi:hypothetical protein